MERPSAMHLQGVGLSAGRSVQSTGLWDVCQGMTTWQTSHFVVHHCKTYQSCLNGLVGMQEVVIVGGLEMQQQAKALARRPHVVVATPGRLKVWVLLHTHLLHQRLHRRTV